MQPFLLEKPVAHSTAAVLIGRIDSRYIFNSVVKTAMCTVNINDNLVDNDVIVLQSGFGTFREVVFKRVNNAMQEFDHKQWRN